jgi:hypothetical protein
MIESQSQDPKLWQRAIHEAGHAVAALARGIKVLGASLQPGISPRGVPISSSCEIDVQCMEGESPAHAGKRAMTAYYAGAAAEALFFDECPIKVFRRQKDDRKNVRKCVEYLRSQGLSDCDVRKCRKHAWEEATCLAEKHMSAISAIALQLYHKHTLSGPEIEDIVRRIDPTIFENG